MIDIASKDGRSRFQLGIDKNRVAGNSISLPSVCTLKQDKETSCLAVNIAMDRIKKFAARLQAMHAALEPGAEATLWGEDGRLVMTFTCLGSGQIQANCLR